jgi:hypothetical protein
MVAVKVGAGVWDRRGSSLGWLTGLRGRSIGCGVRCVVRTETALPRCRVMERARCMGYAIPLEGFAGFVLLVSASLKFGRARDYRI